MVRTDKIENKHVPEATGASISKVALLREKKSISVKQLEGYYDGMPPKSCTEMINTAIKSLHDMGGGTIVFSKGTYRVYTIVLLSNVNLYLEKDAHLCAARTDVDLQYINQHVQQAGEGGNYLEPEVNRYLGLQDHGHSYFANSLIYAREQENMMIYGEGVIEGSYLDEKTGIREFVLLGADPMEPLKRSLPGYREDTTTVNVSLFDRNANDSEIAMTKGSWFGNKAIAFVNCRHVVFADFSVIIGGHFAMIMEGVEDLYVERVLVDTNRDALDLDCCQNVTVRNSTFNSLTDDGICVKASYGAGRFLPSKIS